MGGDLDMQMKSQLLLNCCICTALQGLFPRLLCITFDIHTKKNPPFYFKVYLQANTIAFSLILHDTTKMLLTGRLVLKIPCLQGYSDVADFIS